MNSKKRKYLEYLEKKNKQLKRDIIIKIFHKTVKKLKNIWTITLQTVHIGKGNIYQASLGKKLKYQKVPWYQENPETKRNYQRRRYQETHRKH